MTPNALLELFRTEVADLEEPPLWTDQEIRIYIDEAETMFYRFTGGYGAIETLSLAPGDEWADYPEGVLKIRGANRADNGRPVAILNYEDLTRLDDRTGTLQSLVIGMTDAIRLYPKLNESVEVNLLVDRLPERTVSAAGKFHTPALHHYSLLYWVKRCAYLKEDAETFDRGRSQDNEARFRDYCQQVDLENGRAKHKNRVVMYGGL